MKATGNVRRIDDLGRVVIPKEIRNTNRQRQSVLLTGFFLHRIFYLLSAGFGISSGINHDLSDFTVP